MSDPRWTEGTETELARIVIQVIAEASGQTVDVDQILAKRTTGTELGARLLVRLILERLGDSGFLLPPGTSEKTLYRLFIFEATAIRNNEKTSSRTSRSSEDESEIDALAEHLSSAGAWTVKEKRTIYELPWSPV